MDEAKIKGINKINVFEMTVIDDGEETLYYRFSSKDWMYVIGESLEAKYDYSVLEQMFQESLRLSEETTPRG